MLKIFISQPMRDKTDEEILKERQRAIEIVKEKFGDNEVEILDTFFEDFIEEDNPLEFLGRSIIYLGKADLAYFIKGWENARGCRIEHLCASEYGVSIIEE